MVELHRVIHLTVRGKYMKLDIAAQWTAALRSGEYKQGKKYLKNGENYCCLGVLCELAAEAGVIRVRTEEDRLAAGGCSCEGCCESTAVVTYRSTEDLWDSATGVLPGAVMEWAGIESSEGKLPVVVSGNDHLTGLNDEAGLSFSEIADVIDQYAADL